MHWGLFLLIPVGNFSFLLPPSTEVTGQAQRQDSTTGPGTAGI